MYHVKKQHTNCSRDCCLPCTRPRPRYSKPPSPALHLPHFHPRNPSGPQKCAHGSPNVRGILDVVLTLGAGRLHAFTAHPTRLRLAFHREKGPSRKGGRPLRCTRINPSDGDPGASCAEDFNPRLLTHRSLAVATQILARQRAGEPTRRTSRRCRVAAHGVMESKCEQTSRPPRLQAARSGNTAVRSGQRQKC